MSDPIPQYKTVIIDDHPDAILNSHAVHGWELICVTQGGYTDRGKFHEKANVLWLKRDKPVPIDDEVVESE